MLGSVISIHSTGMPKYLNEDCPEGSYLGPALAGGSCEAGQLSPQPGRLLVPVTEPQEDSNVTQSHRRQTIIYYRCRRQQSTDKLYI